MAISMAKLAIDDGMQVGTVVFLVSFIFMLIFSG